MRSTSFYFILAFLFFCNPELLSQEQKITDPVETKSFRVILYGDDGKPVQGATVQPFGMRCAEDKGSHWGWPTSNVGPAPKVVSNQEGIAEIPYPVRFGREPDWLKTCQLSISVRHHDYVAKECHPDIQLDDSENETVIHLEPGCEASVSAIDEAKNGTSFGIISSTYFGEWVEKEGFLRSRSIPSGIFPALLVAPRQNGETLFSDVQTLNLSKEQSEQIRNVPLKKGIRFFGKLPEDVPRPVTNGHIAIEFCPEFDPEGKDIGKVYWYDWTKIEEDGSFNFPSIPRKGTMRIFIHCKGWMQEESGNNPFVQGIDIDVEESNSKDGALEFNPPMEETGELEVTLIDSEGEPIAEARIDTWPNMTLLSGGSTIIGLAMKSIVAIEQSLKPQDSERNVDSVLETKNYQRFSSVSNAEGVAVLRDIPLRRTESMRVEHAVYALPNAGPPGGQPNRIVQYKIDAPGTKKVIYELVKLKEEE